MCPSARFAATLALLVGPAALAGGRADDVVVLFDGKSLGGWTTYVSHAEMSIDPKTDPMGVFRVEDGLIHVSGE